MQHVSCVQFRGVDDPSTATALAMHGRWTQSAAARVPVRAVDLAALASPVARERMREVQALAAAGDEPHMYAALLLLVTRSQGEEVASALQQQVSEGQSCGAGSRKVPPGCSSSERFACLLATVCSLKRHLFSSLFAPPCKQEYLELLVSELEMFGVDAEGRTMQYNRSAACFAVQHARVCAADLQLHLQRSACAAACLPLRPERHSC